MLTLITNRQICGDEKFIETVVRAIRAGVDQVILREKDLNTMTLKEFGQIFRTEMKPNQNLIIHSDVEAAEAISADGVQLTFSCFMNMSKEDVCALKKDMHFIVGVSVHSSTEAKSAVSHGATYLLASHVFNTDCKAGTPGRGVSFIEEICAVVDVPVIGLGGIDIANASKVISAGASGIAVMSGIMGAKDVSKVINRFKIELTSLIG